MLILGNKRYNENSIFSVDRHIDGITLGYHPVQHGWTKPGEDAYTLEEVGNGFNLVDHNNETTINLNFAQAQALRALLKMIDTDDCTYNYYEVK